MRTSRLHNGLSGSSTPSTHGCKQWRPAGVEANVHATRFVEVDGEAIPIHINGFIDTLFADDDGFALMELKTGKYKARSKVPSMRKEMAFYK